MKVMCIDNDGLEVELTLGKYYDIIFEGRTTIEILSDIGDRFMYARSKFRTIEEIREYKLNELGI